MAIKKEILEQFLKDKDPKTMFSSDGLLGELKKALAERVLNTETDHHLSDSNHDEVLEGDKPANHRVPSSKIEFPVRRDLESGENTSWGMGRVLLARRQGPVLRIQESRKRQNPAKPAYFC
jgi:hypothetical protein